MSVKVRWWDASLAFWILAKVTILFLWNLRIFLTERLLSYPEENQLISVILFIFLYIPAEIFGFSFNPRCKIKWTPGEMVYKTNYFKNQIFRKLSKCQIVLSLYWHQVTNVVIKSFSKHNVINCWIWSKNVRRSTTKVICK